MLWSSDSPSVPNLFWARSGSGSLVVLFTSQLKTKQTTQYIFRYAFSQILYFSKLSRIWGAEADNVNERAVLLRVIYFTFKIQISKTSTVFTLGWIPEIPFCALHIPVCSAAKLFQDQLQTFQMSAEETKLTFLVTGLLKH